MRYVELLGDIVVFFLIFLVMSVLRELAMGRIYGKDDFKFTVSLWGFISVSLILAIVITDIINK